MDGKCHHSEENCDNVLRTYKTLWKGVVLKFPTGTDILICTSAKFVVWYSMQHVVVKLQKKNTNIKQNQQISKPLNNEL